MASRAKKKQIKQKDFLAEQGLSSNRKKGLSLTAYIYIKIGLLIALPLVYFLYSPCTIFVIAGFIFSYILGFKAERTENQSVAKANRISIFKVDAALALIVVVVAVGGMISDTFSVTSHSFMQDLVTSDFDEDDDNYSEMQWRMFWRSLKEDVVTLGSLSTGNRSFLDYLGVTGGEFSFSKGERPEGGSGGPPGGGGPPPNLSVDDLPIEYLTKTVLSMVNTILIACVFVGGIMSLVLIYVKKNKMKKEEERGAVDFSNSSLTDDAIEKLIGFGDVEEVFEEKYQQVRMLVGVSFEQIEQEIEQENQASSAKSKKEVKVTETVNVAVEEVETEVVEAVDVEEVDAEVTEVEAEVVEAEVIDAVETETDAVETDEQENKE